MSAGLDTNIFAKLEQSHGLFCFQNVDKVKKIKNTLAKFISSSGCYHLVVIDIIQQALDFHKIKNYNGKKNPSIFCTYPSGGHCQTHGVITIALHLCQKYNLSDDSIVQNLLLECYRCENGFNRFLCFLDPLIFPFEVDPILFPFPANKCGSLITKKHLNVLEYFLWHSRGITMPVEFSDFKINVDGSSFSQHTEYVSMAEIPISSCRDSTPLLLASHSMNSNAVLLLLRYGANPLHPGQVQNFLGMQFQHPLYVIATKLNASVFWKTHNHQLEPAIRLQFMERQNRNEQELKLCLQYICRALPSLPVVVSNHVQTVNPTDLQNPNLFNLHPVYKDLIPVERYSSAAELSHLCRCTIRTTLRQRCQLPNGIEKLPLPRILQDYLDLMSD